MRTKSIAALWRFSFPVILGLALVGCGSNVSDGPSDSFTLSPEVTQSQEDTQSWLADIGGFYVGYHLVLAQTTITDAGLERFEEMPYFDELDLANTKITDAGLEHLKGLTELKPFISMGPASPTLDLSTSRD